LSSWWSTIEWVMLHPLGAIAALADAYRPVAPSFGPLGILVGGFIAFLSLVLAFFSFRRSLRNERRRKTLEACENFLLRDPAWPALSRTIIAINEGSFPLDTVPQEAGSLRNDVSLLINYLETIAMGVSRGFYSDKIAQDYVTPYVAFFFEHFLRDDPEAPPRTSMRWHDAEVESFRKVFGFPRFRKADRLTRAAEIVRSLDRAGPSGGRPSREALLALARRLENDPDPARRRDAHKILFLVGVPPARPAFIPSPPER
jgi:hypothetical protein